LNLGKDLLRTIRAGALATLDRAHGFPFASLVTVATDHDGSPLLLLSRLATHTVNLERDARASILLTQSGKGDPLAPPRLTVLGRAERRAEPHIRARFLARHPKAELYAGFADFSFWRLTVEGAHLNGGFARAAGLTARELLTDVAQAKDLVAAEEETLARINGDPETLALGAAIFAGAEPGPWVATGLDPEGLDLAAGDRTARIRFPEPVRNPASVTRLLTDLARRARGGASAEET
jgi:heme oxygenase (biliverdin-IX-beta and delta-forming)